MKLNLNLTYLSTSITQMFNDVSHCVITLQFYASLCLSFGRVTVRIEEGDSDCIFPNLSKFYMEGLLCLLVILEELERSGVLWSLQSQFFFTRDIS